MIRAPSGRRLRVCTLIDSLPSTGGGAERLAALVVLRLDPARFDRIVCTTRPDDGPTFDDDLRADGVRILELRRRSKLDLGAWAPFYALLRRERVDVVHAHKFGSNLYASLLARLARVPVVVAHEHTWSFAGEPLRRLLDREVIGRLADVVVAVSREDRRKLIELEGLHPDKVRFVPNGVPPLPAPSARDLRGELGIPAGAPVVGCVSVLRAQKRVDLLLEAAALLRDRVPGVRVLVAGGGEEEASVRALARRLGLGETVTLLGALPAEEIPDLLHAADVAVNTSDYEGTPLSVLEFMAAGKAIVATEVGGVPDLIADGREGVLVPPGDARALADALEAVLLDEPRRRRLGAAARSRYERELSIDVTVARLELLYEELTRARAAGRRPPPPGATTTGPSRSRRRARTAGSTAP